MNYLYKLVTTENIEINYDAFKKKELIECLATMRDIYFSLKQENKKLNGAIQTYDILLKSNVAENKQLRIKISAREEVCNELENNWNKLKEIIKKKQDYYRHFKDNRYRKFLSELLDKMQELEGSDSNDSN